MSLFDRILLTLYTMVVAILSLFVMAAYVNFPPSWGTLELARALTRWETIPVAILFFLFSLRFLLSGGKKERRRATITHHSELGDVTITLAAIQNLAQRAAQTVRGVRDAKVSVHLADDMLVITAKVSASLDSSAPAISAALQETIKSSVEASAGVGVKEVKVFVEDMSPAKKVRVQ